MNLKSKAISEIRETIETLTAHPECADRIEGLQVLLAELTTSNGTPTDQEIDNEANLYQVDEYDCGNTGDLARAFKEGAEWTISQMQPEWVSVTDRLPEEEADYYVSVNGKVATQTYCGSNRWVSSDNHYPKTSEILKITHWMKKSDLPQPPTK